MPAATTTQQPLTGLEQIADRLEGALERSPADETELVWLEARRRQTVVSGRRGDFEDLTERTLLVRVIDHGRVGSHRTGVVEPAEIDSAVRAAVAQSRAREPLPGLPHLPPDEGAPPELGGLRDPALAELDRDGAERLLKPLRRRGERLRLRWAEARVAVFNNRGLRRSTEVTAVSLAASCGRRPGAGRAVDAARGLALLDAEAVCARARACHGRGDPGTVPADPGAALLSPEAAARLCDLLNHEAFSASAYYEGTSLLREHLGVQVFDRALSLRDDATDPAGLPFPFDLEGTPKRPVHLIEHGSPRTPALDQRQAAVLGLPPTAHAVAGADARACNLFLEPGELGEEELLGRADGGLRVGWLEPLECFEPTRLQLRAVLRGVRRIRDGRLAEPLPDLVWESSLLRTFSSLLGVGRAPARRLASEGYLGAIAAPALAVPMPGAELLREA